MPTPSRTRRLATLIATLFAAGSLSGCIVAGYSSRGGFFLWPGSVVLTILVIVILALFRRR